jgi:hypothetical protein
MLSTTVRFAEQKLDGHTIRCAGWLVILLAGLCFTTTTALGQDTATWSAGSGNWTTPAEWSCTPGPGACVPNNNVSNNYTAVLNSPGNTLTLDSTSSPTGISINNLTLTAGTLGVGTGTTLNLASQPNGITDIPGAAGLDVAGTFTAGSGSGLAKLAGVEGTLTLEGQTLTATPGGGTLTTPGTVNLQQTTVMTVSGNLSNSGTINTGNGVSDTGNNSLAVSGALTNTGAINLNGTGDSLTVTGGFSNSNSSGSLVLYGSNQSVSLGALNNNGGTVYTNGPDEGVSGQTLTAANWLNLDSSGNLSAPTLGSYYNIAGIFHYSSPSNGIVNILNGIVGLEYGGLITPDGTTDALAGLTSNNGQLGLADRPESFTPASGTFTNSGALYLYNDGAFASSTTLTVNGNFDTSNLTLFNGSSATVLNVTGNSSNEGNILMFGPGDSFSTTGTLTNSGNIYLYGSGASLAANTNLTNSGSLQIEGSNETVTVGGAFSNTGYLYSNGPWEGQSGNTLTVGSWSNLDGSGNLTGGGYYDISGVFKYASPANGIRNIGSGVTLFMEPGGLITPNGTMDALAGLTGIAGTLSLNDYNETITPGAGALTNSGSLVLYNDQSFANTTTLKVNGNFNNTTGNVTVGQNTQMTVTNNYTQSGAGASTKVNGTLQASSVTINSGVLSGGGTIAANLSNFGGTVTASDPGSPDTLIIEGNYSQGSGGILEAFLRGTTPGTDYSQLVVDGAASLGGTLDVDLVPGSGLVITPGESFDLLMATDGITGTFANVEGLPALPGGDSWLVGYNAGSLDITLEGSADYHAAPEPSALLLLAVGIAMISFLLKHRNSVTSNAG